MLYIYVMEHRKQPRRCHVTPKQKKMLVEFITRHPELISCKVTQEFSYQDSQKLWQSITDECNAVPGARKTWKQWRKTWQDLRSKTKKRQEDINGALPTSVVMLTVAEQEALGLKNVSSTDEYQDITEFVPLETDNTEDNNFHLEMESAPSLSEPDSPPEVKVFTRSEHKSKIKLKKRSKDNHASDCALNCELLAVHEQKKLELKEDYINFKKDYLRQKLKLIKEQTEALKIIARGLSEK